MIVRDAATIKKYVAINSSLSFENLNASQVERKYIKPLLGPAQYAVFDVDSAPTDAIVKEAYDLAQEAISFLTLYEAFPTLAIQITDAGVFQASTDTAQVATETRLKDMQRAMKRRGLETLDEMLLVMENNLTKFDAWKNNEAYKRYTKLLVNSTAVFNEHFYIANSRQTFMALYPNLETVEYQFIAAPVTTELLTALKQHQTEALRIEVKSLLQKAIVNFTVARVALTGFFVMDATGIHVRFDLLPYEYNIAGNAKTDAVFLKNKAENHQTEGEQFLKKALALVTANPSDFTEYTPPAVVEPKKLTHNTKSITLL